MKNIAIFTLLLLFSGCICCGGDGGEEDDYEEEYCQSPYIQVGSECCLDQNSNNICDKDEEITMTTSIETTTTQKMVETTVYVPTTAAVITTSTSIAPSYAPAYECVKKLGGKEVADGIFFIYSTNCGDKFISTASTVEGRTGVEVTKMKIGGYMDDEKINVLECFYGQHYDGHPEFGKCPRLLCPKSGEVKTLSGMGSANVLSQMTGFAKNC